MSDDRAPLLNLGGLWKTTSKAGNEYLRGRLGGTVIMILPNRYKERPNQPDYIMWLAAAPPKEHSENKDVSGPILDSELPF
ncbi:MAG: hypothetical protein WC505_05865 [Patescibacteria group bacterium]